MKKVGPYESVTHDHVREDGYRLLLSGALNAMGLIGPEMNGIVVLDEVNRQVVTDCVGRQSSGWYAGSGEPGPRLIALFEELAAASPEDFAERVNDLGKERARCLVEVRDAGSRPGL